MAVVEAISGSMRVLARVFARIAKDLCLLASGPATGLHELQLPLWQPGASIMLGKVNPVMAEMLDMPLIRYIGCDAAVSLETHAGQLELNVMMRLIVHELFEMMDISTCTFTAFATKCVDGVEMFPTRAAVWLERHPMIATAFMPMMGYDQVAGMISLAYERGEPMRDIVSEMAEGGDLALISGEGTFTLEEARHALNDIHTLTGREADESRKRTAFIVGREMFPGPLDSQ